MRWIKVIRVKRPRIKIPKDGLEVKNYRLQFYGTLIQSLAILISAIALGFSIYQNSVTRIQSERATFNAEYYALSFSLVKEFVQNLERYKYSVHEENLDKEEIIQFRATLSLVTKVFPDEVVLNAVDKLDSVVRLLQTDPHDAFFKNNITLYSDSLINITYEKVSGQKKYFDSLRVVGLNRP